jgi:NAD(P)-dependent dehydrogenase (short-subunit alcohol dehydrogenase family)
MTLSEPLKPWWILVGGRARLGRALAEDLSVDHRLVLTSSRPWDVQNDERTPWEKAARTFQWKAEDPSLVERMNQDLLALKAEGIALQGAVIVAGTFPEQAFGQWTQESLHQTWMRNLSFPLLAAQTIAAHLDEGACLQFLLDTAIHRPWLKRLPYSAAKSGLAAMVSGLAQTLAPRQRVVGHALGTALIAEHDDLDFLKKRSLLQRIGEPADLARAIRYAADSPYLTGEILTLDGGRRWI